MKIWAIIKKDLRRFFTDPRILVSLFLPGVLIYALYSIMGGFLSSKFDSADEFTIYARGVPEEMAQLLSPEGVNATILSPEGKTDDEIKELVRGGEAQAYIIFSDNFNENLGNGAGIMIYYCSAESASAAAFSIYSAIFDAYEDQISNVFDINAGEGFDLSTDEEFSISFISMLLPMLLLIFLWTSCMSVTAESIAGEKERGTMATLLVTPVKRSHLALAKVASMSVTALAGAAVSTIGTVLSIPKLFDFGDINVNAGVYGAGQYFAIFAIILLTVLLFNVALIAISAAARSVKEATGYASAAMVFIMLIAISCMLGSAPTEFWAYLIPVYNSAQCLSAITSLTFSPVNFAVTVISNAVYIGVGIFIITKMFLSERIMFGK